MVNEYLASNDTDIMDYDYDYNLGLKNTSSNITLRLGKDNLTT